MMRRPTVSSIVCDRLNSASYWKALRAACAATIYPSGCPTATMDSHADVEIGSLGITVRRYTMINPGGRSGGTPQYADIWHPGGTPARCLVYCGGHLQGTPWYDYYASTNGSSVMRRMVAQGWLVAYVPMAAYDINPNPQELVLGGETVEVVSNHSYSVGFSDEGPSPNRYFTDVAIAVANSVQADYGIERFALAGHSGGASSVPMIAVCDDRFEVVRTEQGGTFGVTGGAVDIEQWSGNPLFTAACAGDSVRAVTAGEGHPWLLAAAAAVDGRVTVCDYADADEYFGESLHPGSTVAWQNLVAKMSVWLSTIGANVELYIKSDLAPDNTYHSVSISQAAATEAHLLAHMP